MAKNWRARGLTVAEFARQHGIDPWRVGWSRKKLELAAQTPSVAAFEAGMLNGRTVGAATDFEASALRRLLGAVEQVSPPRQNR